MPFTSRQLSKGASFSVPVSFSNAGITLVSHPTISQATDAAITEHPEFLVFEKWCDGRSIGEVVEHRLKEFHKREDKESNLLSDILGEDIPSCYWSKNLTDEQCKAVAASDDLLLKYLFTDETTDLFRVFEEMGQYLIHPELLRVQPVLQIPYASELWMLDRYYSFDDRVVRECLGRRLSQKVRRDLDDVALATNTTLSSCRRQFDNLKRIMAMLEDTTNQFQCIAVNEIRTRFHLSDKLAAWYTAYTFLIHRRFNLSSSKKQTAGISASSMGWCAMAILNYWVVYGHRVAALDGDITDLWQTDSGLFHSTAQIMEMVQPALMDGLKDVGQVDLDRSLRNSIRDIRLVLNEDHSPSKMPMLYILLSEVQKAASQVLPQELMVGLEKKSLDCIFKNLLNIGGNLGQSREYRDILDDLITRVFHPLRDVGLCSSQIVTLLEVMSEQFQILSISTFPNAFRDPNAGKHWQRYVRCISICSLYLSSDN